MPMNKNREAVLYVLGELEIRTYALEILRILFAIHKKQKSYKLSRLILFLSVRQCFLELGDNEQQWRYQLIPGHIYIFSQALFLLLDGLLNIGLDFLTLGLTFC